MIRADERVMNDPTSGDPNHIEPFDEDSVTLGPWLTLGLVIILCGALLFYAATGVYFWHVALGLG
jgi:hypothetical protein